jgi:tetratricopeptide (TPR) repeat protein
MRENVYYCIILFIWVKNMKKTIILAALFAILTGCSSASLKETDRSSAKAEKKSEVKESIKSDWSDYSYGLYFKNSARSEPDNERKNKLLKRAISRFIQAGKSGKSLDRIYFQLSDSYFLLKNFEKSIEYALKSIEVNKNNPAAYTRLYNTYMIFKNYKSAAGILENYMKLYPNDIRTQYVLAEHYYKRLENYKESIVKFNRVIEISRRTSAENYYVENAYYSLGYITYKTGDLRSSIRYFEKVREVNSRNTNAAYMLAILYIEEYQLENAEKYAEIFLEKNPFNYVMLSIKGRALYLKGDPSAISFFSRVKKSNTIEGFLSRGLYLYIKGKKRESEKYIRTVIKYRPNFISAHLVLAEIEDSKKKEKAAFNEFITAGVLAYKKKVYNVARYCFNRSLQYKLQVPEVYFYLGRVYEEMGNTSLAILNYKKVYEMKESLDMLLHIGYLYGLKKDTQNSLKYFDRAIDMEPENSKPYFYKGLGFLRGNKYIFAEENIKKAIDLNREKNKEKYYFYLAIVLEKQNKFSEAVESLETAIKHNPKSARAYNYLGYLFADKNINIDRSFSLIQKALKIDPGNGAYLDSLGWVYYRKGDYKQALKNILMAEKELNRVKTPDPVVYDHLGDIYKKMGNISKAVNYWEKSIKIKKDGKVENKIKKFQNSNSPAQ